MEYKNGGELFFWLKADKRFGINRALLYFAEIMLGLEELHKQNVVYRSDCIDRLRPRQHF